MRKSLHGTAVWLLLLAAACNGGEGGPGRATAQGDVGDQGSQIDAVGDDSAPDTLFPDAQGSLQLPNVDGVAEELAFEEVEPGVFVAHSPDYLIRIDATGITLTVFAFEGALADFPLFPEPVDERATATQVRLVFRGNLDVTPAGLEPVGTRIRYTEAGRRAAAGTAYRRVVLEGLYSGISAEFAGVNGRLKMGFTMSAGADLSLVEFAVPDATVAVEESGQINLETPAGRLVLTEPVASQGEGREGIPVPAGVVGRDDEYLGIVLGPHDPDRPVNIDPAFVFTDLTSLPTDRVWASALSGGQLTVVGEMSRAPRDPGALGAIDQVIDAFIARPGDDGLEVRTLQGDGFDTFRALADTPGGSVVAVGGISSGDDTDVVVASFDFGEVTPHFVTTLAGSGHIVANGVAVADGVIWVVGEIEGQFHQDLDPIGDVTESIDGFVALLNDAGEVERVERLGGDGTDGLRAAHIDDQGDVWIMGYSEDDGLAADGTAAGDGVDVFLGRLDRVGSLAAGWLYGTEADDFPAGWTPLASGGFALTGVTRTVGGDEDGFVMATDAGELLFWTELTGAGSDRGLGVSETETGRLVAVGATDSADFVEERPIQAAAPGWNGFVVELDPEGEVVFATQFGGTGHDLLFDVQAGDTWLLAGASNSLDFVNLSALATKPPLRIGAAFALELDAPVAAAEFNRRPTARVDGAVELNLTCGLTLDGLSSSDADGTVERFDWVVVDALGEREFLDAGGQFAYLPRVAGTHRVRLTVTDDGGSIDRVETEFEVVDRGGHTSIEAFDITAPVEQGGDPTAAVTLRNQGAVELPATEVQVLLRADGGADPVVTLNIPVPGLDPSTTLAFSRVIDERLSGRLQVQAILDPDGSVLGCLLPPSADLEDTLLDFEAPGLRVSTPAPGTTVNLASPTLQVVFEDELSGVASDTFTAGLVGLVDGLSLDSSIGQTTSVRDVLSADIDGDGDLDLLVAGAAWLAAFTDEGGVLTPSLNYSPATRDYQLVAVGQFLGDESVDLIAFDYTAPALQIFEGGGDGTFATEGATEVSISCQITALAVGDLLPDAGVEIAYACEDESTLFVVTNDLATTQGLARSVWSPVSASPSRLIAADFDGGLDELVVGAGGRLSVLNHNALNDPPFEILRTEAGGTGRIPAVGDVNNDGNLDLVSLETTSGIIHLGDGSGGFATQVWTPAAFGSKLADLMVVSRGPDRPALLVAVDSHDAGVHVFRANGSGGFGPAETTSRGRVPWAAAGLPTDAGGVRIVVADFATSDTEEALVVLADDDADDVVVGLTAIETSTSGVSLQPSEALVDGWYRLSVSVSDRWHNSSAAAAEFRVHLE